MKYNYLLFDLDGTLFDYDKAESEALKNTFIQFGLNYDSAYLIKYREINHLIWQDYENGKIAQNKLKAKRFEQLSASINIKFNPSQFSIKYLTNLSKGTALINGSVEVLSKLYGNTKLYLITNGLKDVQRPRIKNSVIGKYFEDVIISEEVGVAKPQKEIFDISFKMMDNPDKNEVLIIGDSLTSDIIGGINYGIDTCWFNPGRDEINGNALPTYEIHNLHELLELIY